jgi:hypothetical protein
MRPCRAYNSMVKHRFWKTKSYKRNLRKVQNIKISIEENLNPMFHQNFLIARPHHRSIWVSTNVETVFKLMRFHSCACQNCFHHLQKKPSNFLPRQVNAIRLNQQQLLSHGRSRHAAYARALEVHKSVSMKVLKVSKASEKRVFHTVIGFRLMKKNIYNWLNEMIMLAIRWPTQRPNYLLQRRREMLVQGLLSCMHKKIQIHKKMT